MSHVLDDLPSVTKIPPRVLLAAIVSAAFVLALLILRPVLLVLAQTSPADVVGVVEALTGLARLAG